MSRIKPVRGTINGLPPRRPFAPIAIEWRGVEAQPGDHCERVTLAGIDRDPFSRAGLAVAAELCRT